MPENAREIFVKNLNEIMARRGITQSDIIRELNVSSATVSNWCTGKKYPRIDVMQRLADLLGVTCRRPARPGKIALDENRKTCIITMLVMERWPSG